MNESEKLTEMLLTELNKSVTLYEHAKNSYDQLGLLQAWWSFTTHYRKVKNLVEQINMQSPNKSIKEIAK